MRYKVKEVRLKSGAGGLLIDAPGVKVMRFNICFMAGTLLCPPEKPDLAHMLEHMVLKANARHPQERDLVIEMCKNGASLNAYTGGNTVGYEVSCADFEWRRVLELLVFSVSKPLLLDEHFATELAVVREEMTRHLDNYPRIVSTSITKAVGNMDLTPRTRVDCLANLRPADLREFYERTHFAANMRFVIAGDLSGKEREIERILAGRDLISDGRARFARIDLFAGAVGEPVTVNRESAGKLYFELRTGRLKKERFALRELVSLGILKELLIGNAGTSLAARINGRARERGLTYGIHCQWSSLGDASFSFAGSMNEENAPELFELITAETKRLAAGGLTAAELEEMKRRFLGARRCREITTAGLADHYEHYTVLDPGDECHDYDADIKLLPDIKKEDVTGVCEYLLSEPWNLGLLGADADRLGDGLYAKLP